MIHNFIACIHRTENKTAESFDMFFGSLISPCPRDLRFLRGLDTLTTLNLDSNRLDSHARFPSLPNLRVLWVNRNEISNLSLFVENLAVSCPCLSHLSMMNNTAAPSYFNGGSRQEYNDYRWVYTLFRGHRRRSSNRE